MCAARVPASLIGAAPVYDSLKRLLWFLKSAYTPPLRVGELEVHIESFDLDRGQSTILNQPHLRFSIPLLAVTSTSTAAFSRGCWTIMFGLSSIARTVRTARHLKASQLAWRIRYLIEGRFNWYGRLKTYTNVESALRDESFPMPPVFHRPGPDDRVDRLKRGEFCHLHRAVDLGRTAPNWMVEGHDVSGLWSITLQYHAWAYDLAEAAAAGDTEAFALYRHYLEDWINRCHITPKEVNPLVWNAFAISTRLSWWIRSLVLVGDQLVPEFERRMLVSICEQADHLSRHIEWDLRANHVMRDAVGLAWAGRFIRSAEARSWMKQATEIALDQVREQILDDGGHYERSPMYHIHVMEDVLSLATLLEDESARSEMRTAWRRMAEFIRHLRHPDGHIPLLNDGAHHAVCDATRMLELGRGFLNVDVKDEHRSSEFQATGTPCWHGNPWTVFFDAGPVGPDFQPGHTHADSLTMECSFGPHRLFVDPGTFDYCTTDRRAYDRSTAAHNTVCIDETNSSEVWGIFRVGHRAYPLSVSTTISDDTAEFHASHNGYDRLPGRPIHSRSISVANNGSLSIRDSVSGHGQHQLDGGFLLAPSWSANATDDGWSLTHSDGDRLTVAASTTQDVRFAVTERPFHPEYGREESASRLQWTWQGELPFEIALEVKPF